MTIATHPRNRGIVPASRRGDPAEALDSSWAKTLGKFSVARAIGRLARGEKLDGIEREVDTELWQRRQNIPGELKAERRGNLFVPLDAPMRAESRDLTTGTGITPTWTAPYGPRWIDVLRAKSLVLKFGATLYSDAIGGSYKLPRKSVTSGAYWCSESNAPTESTPQIGAVALTPKTEGAYVDVTRKMMVYTKGTVEQVIVDDLGATLATELDRVALAGTGTGAEPKGLLSYTANPPATSEIPLLSLAADGDALAFADLCAMERILATNNADAATGRLGWITTPNARASLRQTEKAAGSGLAWGDDNVLLGYQADATNQLPANLTKGTGTGLSCAIFGNWADLVIGTWGTVDILVDPYAFGGVTIRIIAHLDCDVQPRHNESFVICRDIVTTP